MDTYDSLYHNYHDSLYHCASCGKLAESNGCTYPDGFGGYQGELVCHDCLDSIMDAASYATKDKATNETLSSCRDAERSIFW